MSSSYSQLDVPRTLCQPPNGSKSCGACCGMYNQRAHTQSHTLLEALRARTIAFKRTDPNALAEFRRLHEPRPDEKLLDGLPSCPFLGMLGVHADVLESDDDLTHASQARVGCMVHPLQNDGVDGRDCGVYDRFICEDYLCAAHDVMKREEKWLVLTAVKDSYLYGLVITDIRFVRELFEAAARINGMYPPARVLYRSQAVHAARDYFELKRDWPHRHAVDGIFGHVTPAQELDTTRRARPSESVGVPEDEHESILHCLGTDVANVEELERARLLVRERLVAFAREVEV